MQVIRLPFGTQSHSHINDQYSHVSPYMNLVNKQGDCDADEH